MQKVYIHVLFIFFAIFAFGALAQSAHAAFLDFDPTSVTANVDGTFSVKVTIDTGSEKSPSSTVIVSYDSEIIEPVSAANGTFFADSTDDEDTSGRVSFFGFNNDPEAAKSGKGTVATITFKGVKEGTSKLEFICDSSNSSDTSTIEKDDIDATNIISCGQNGTASVTIGAASDTTDSDGDGIPDTTDTDANGDGITDSTASSSLEGPDTSTVSALPRTGTLDNIAKFALPGIFFIGIGVALKLFVL